MTRREDPDRTLQRIPASTAGLLPPLPIPPGAADRTQAVRIQDVLEEVIIPGGDADRTLPRRALVPTATGEIDAADILSQQPMEPLVIVQPAEPVVVPPRPGLVDDFGFPVAAERAIANPSDFDEDVPNRDSTESAPSWEPPKRPWLLAGIPLALLVIAVVAFAATCSSKPSNERVGVTVHTVLSNPLPEGPVPPPPPPAPSESAHASGTDATDVVAPQPSSPAHAAQKPHARTGHIRATGASHDALMFVDGASVGRGDVTVACGVHNVSLGMGKMRRVQVPCGGSVSIH